MSANITTTETANRPWRLRSWLGPRSVAIVLVVVLAATTAGAWGLVRSGSPKPTGLVDRASWLATITERTITSQQLVNGTLGFAGAASVLQAVGTAPDAVAQADEKAAAAEQSLVQASTDRSAAEATLSDDLRTLASDQVAADQKQVEADWQKVGADQKALAQAQASVATAERSSPVARSAAADAHGSALAFGQTSTYTTLPAIGQVVTRGQALFAISAQPVPLLYGPVMPWRAFSPGMSAGPDVAELNQNLADLGYGAGLAASDSSAAIRRPPSASSSERSDYLRRVSCCGVRSCSSRVPCGSPPSRPSSVPLSNRERPCSTSRPPPARSRSSSTPPSNPRSGRATPSSSRSRTRRRRRRP